MTYLIILAIFLVSLFLWLMIDVRKSAHMLYIIPLTILFTGGSYFYIDSLFGYPTSLTNEKKLDDLSTVELNKDCSTILQNKLSNKLKDLESFTIPCLIGSLNVEKALADLTASINVMPYKMFKQLGFG